MPIEIRINPKLYCQAVLILDLMFRSADPFGVNIWNFVVWLSFIVESLYLASHSNIDPRVFNCNKPHAL
jgi:hypothetical protein